MPDDRRSAKRTRLSGLRATYESADGVIQDADVFNLSRAGLFLQTEAAIAVGKRLALEVHVTGEPAPWPALGRVIWTRPARGGEDRPCGMGVKLIDVEDAVASAIERLVDTREQTEPGLGQEPTGEREIGEHEYTETILGVGTAPVTEVLVAPASEPLVTPLVTPLVPESVPLASAGADSASPAVVPATEEGAPGPAIGLVRRIEAADPATPLEVRSEPQATSLPVAAPRPVVIPDPMPVAARPPKPAPRARGLGWIVAGVVIAIAAAAYALRGLLGAQN